VAPRLTPRGDDYNVADSKRREPQFKFAELWLMGEATLGDSYGDRLKPDAVNTGV
jgi:hypothetical protein